MNKITKIEVLPIEQSMLVNVPELDNMFYACVYFESGVVRSMCSPCVSLVEVFEWLAKQIDCQWAVWENQETKRQRVEIGW